MLFTWRSVAFKKAFYSRLLDELARDPGIDPQDIEMTFIEAPRHDWWIRGRAGDELGLDYAVETCPRRRTRNAADRIGRARLVPGGKDASTRRYNGLASTM